MTQHSDSNPATHESISTTTTNNWKRLSLIGGAVLAVGAIIATTIVLNNSDAVGTQNTSSGTPIVEDNYSSVVVTTDWLDAKIQAGDENVRVIEVSTNPGLYERGHIPGAVNFVWTTDFVSTQNRDIVGQAEFTQLAQQAGISEDTTVVLYGDSNNWFAAWGAWVFNLYGHDDVRILDGGRVKWEADGRAYDISVPTFQAGTWEASEANSELRAFLPDVLDIAVPAYENTLSPSAAYSQAADLVDIRGAAEFNGEIFAPEGFQETAIRAGHIPGAVNVTWSKAVAEDGTFLPVEDLRALYAEQGIDGSQPIVVYCRIGERASHTWFILSQILGYDVKLYDGSWTEYGNSVGVPIINNSGTIWGVS